MSYMDRFAAKHPEKPRRSLVVHATYDLTFPLDYSFDVHKNFDALKVDYVSKILPCGHYTTGEFPYKYLDGWYLGSFIYSSFKRLAQPTSRLDQTAGSPSTCRSPGAPQKFGCPIHRAVSMGGIAIPQAATTPLQL